MASGVTGATSDTTGRYTIVGLRAGRYQLVARRIGSLRRDTTITLGAGDTVHWNPVLSASELWVRAAEDQRRADAARAEAGSVDSIATGAVRTDSSGTLTYERFGIELLRAALAPTIPPAGGAAAAPPLNVRRVLSPLSAAQALVLAWGAAVDSTAHAIQQALRIGAPDLHEVARRTRRFNAGFNARTDAELRVANALWVDVHEQLQPTFAEWTRDVFGATARSVPLDSARALPILNGWADSVTRGRIRQVVAAPYDTSVATVLMNAVYMKSVWLEPFEKSETKPRAFTTAAGRRIDVPTMERTATLAFGRGAGYQALRIPYRAGLTAMYVVLPDSGMSVLAVLDSIAHGGWPLPDPRTESVRTHLRLPRFHVEQQTDLRGPFERLGLGIIFDSTRADFAKLVVPRPDRPPPCPPISGRAQLSLEPRCTRIRISKATQDVFLDVDEEGTEAAAVTTLAFELVVTSLPPEPQQFFVDRPFLFALRDEMTGTLLFVGYVADPRE
ncbi:MAG TPA: serpin family protein [Gemmatimonadaceae bacterium]|nr:serpin family protein [Gemmatimonadaceae bacterium]